MPAAMGVTTPMALRGHATFAASATPARISPAMAKRQMRKVKGSACPATSLAATKPVDQRKTKAGGIRRSLEKPAILRERPAKRRHPAVLAGATASLLPEIAADASAPAEAGLGLRQFCEWRQGGFRMPALNMAARKAGDP